MNIVHVNYQERIRQKAYRQCLLLIEQPSVQKLSKLPATTYPALKILPNNKCIIFSNWMLLSISVCTVDYKIGEINMYVSIRAELLIHSDIRLYSNILASI